MIAIRWRVSVLRVNECVYQHRNQDLFQEDELGPKKSVVNIYRNVDNIL